jgi:hypothetical protein
MKRQTNHNGNRRNGNGAQPELDLDLVQVFPIASITSWPKACLPRRDRSTHDRGQARMASKRFAPFVRQLPFGEIRGRSKLMLQLGHTTTRLIFEAYRELVTPEAAEHYWAIMPAEVPANLVQMEAMR